MPFTSGRAGFLARQWRASLIRPKRAPSGRRQPAGCLEHQHEKPQGRAFRGDAAGSGGNLHPCGNSGGWRLRPMRHAPAAKDSANGFRRPGELPGIGIPSWKNPGCRRAHERAWPQTTNGIPHYHRMGSGLYMWRRRRARHRARSIRRQRHGRHGGIRARAGIRAHRGQSALRGTGGRTVPRQ